MVDNAVEYGFRYHSTIGGGPCPVPIPGFVDTAQAFAVNGGGSACVLKQGDLVRRKASGGFEQADGSEDTAQTVFGVVAAIVRYWDGEVMKPSSTLPSAIAWGTNLARQTEILVIPVQGVIWEADVDDIVTATTKTAYQALIGRTVEHVLTGATTGGALTPKIDISGHATTSTFPWQIHGVSPTVKNTDFSEDNVKILVKAHEYQFGPLGVAGL